MSKGRQKLRIRELHLCRHVGWSMDEGLRRKNEWLDLPEMIRGKKSFAIFIEHLITSNTLDFNLNQA